MLTIQRSLPLVALLLCTHVPSSASAGPYASPAMGNIDLKFPSSLQVGGAFVGLFGRGQDQPARSLAGEGFLEYLMLDVLGTGLVVRTHAMPTLIPSGDRVTTVRLRLRLQVPLVRGSRRGVIVPMASLGIDGGAGWIAGTAPGASRIAGAVAGEVRVGVVIVGRVSVYVPLGYERTILPGPDLRQFNVGLGVQVRIAGETDYGPRRRSRIATPERPAAEPSEQLRDVLDRLR